MKKIIAAAIVSLGMFACSNSGKETKAGEPETKPNASMDNPDYDAGLNLVAKSDCFTCHKLREKLVGPSYGDIANKYPNTPETIDTLSNRIIKGSQNIWGPVPMTAHAAVSKADAEKMVKYILLLKD
jgi:cytochrome c